MNKQLSFEEAEVNQLEIPQECSELICMCGFCERWQFIKYNDEHPECDLCEFGKVAGKCCDEDSLYDRFTEIDEDNTEALADAAKLILYKIKQLKENS